jgi:hypothetical protein
MPRRSSRTVWLAKVSFTDRRPSQLTLMHERFPEALSRALDPDRRVTYYREWRLSEPQLRSTDGVLHAQLGFRRRKRQEEVDYDEERHEWVSSEAPARQGNFAHFVVDLETQLVAFEDRGSDLRRDSFLNVLGRFLEASGLEVNLISDAQGFETWLDEVDVVTKFRVTLRPPNPGYSKRAKEVRALAGEVEADRLTIEAESRNGLNVRDTLLDGAADTAAMGNGNFKATGLVGDHRRFFDSAKRFVSGVIEVAQGDSSSTIASKIRDLMRDIAPEVPKPNDNDDE